MAFEQFQLQIEAHHYMEVIGDLVGIRADQRALHLVDRAIEGLEPNLSELVGEGIPQNRVKVFPEGAAAADHIFPKPRLALVYAPRCSSSERRALKRSGDTLLVKRMTGLVHGREQRVAKVSFIDAGGNAHVPRRELAAEWMMGLIEPPAIHVVAEPLDHRKAEVELRRHPERTAQTVIAGNRLIGNGAHDR